MKRQNIQTFMQAATLVAMLLCAFAPPSTAFAQAQSPAQIAWKNKDYKKFLALAVETEKIKPGYASALNVALGLFATHKATDALKKIIEVQNLPALTPLQIQKAATLRADIEKYLQSKETPRLPLVAKFSGSAIMSKESAGGKRDPHRQSFKGNQVGSTSTQDLSDNTMLLGRSNTNRNGRNLGLTPEEAEVFMRAMAMNSVESAGYDVEPQTKTSILPEDGE